MLGDWNLFSAFNTPLILEFYVIIKHIMVNPSIFKAYDIRGVYPDEINEETAYLVGRAFVEFLKKTVKWSMNKKLHIVASRDNRVSSPALSKALIEGLKDGGADVVDIGLATTPMFYFVVAHYGYDGGIQVSASHNPAEYNGLKVVREKAIPVGGESGLQDIYKIADKAAFPKKKKGRVYKKDALRDYIDFQLKDFDISKFRPLKIVVDTANAVPGIVVPKFFRNLPCELFHIFAKLDGRFPNHQADPLKKENLRFLRREVKKKKADMGVAFDGDGDRVIFCDEKGRIISSDIITALIASIILRERPGSKILYDIRSGRATEEAIRKNGGIPLVSRVGHSFIKAQMRKESILFGGEFSGHFYHKDHYFCEAPLWVLLVILREMAITHKPLSELVRPFSIYVQSGELNFEVEDKNKKMKELERHFRGGKVSRLDGVRVDFKDWWFLVRPSNTEPVLRVSIEAKTKKLLEARKRELMALMIEGSH